MMGTVRVAVAPLILLILLGACQQPGLDGTSGGRYTFLEYNVQNLFDTQLTGNEYPEFLPDAPYWNERRYLDRLSRLSAVIFSACEGGPDVVVLCEVESTKVIHDLVDLYLFRLGYTEFAISGDSWSPIQTAVLSRRPILEARRHSPTAGGKVYRSILDVTLDIGPRGLRLLAGHWKSRAGNEEDGSSGRRAASMLTAELLRANAALGGPPALVVGDLNANWDEATVLPSSRASLALPGAAGGQGLLELAGEYPRLSREKPVLFSPWPAWTANGGGGSYYYQGAWETIDHFLVDPGIVEDSAAYDAGLGLVYAGFLVFRGDKLVDREGRPERYVQRSSWGYSDHLPLVLSLAQKKLAGGSD